VIAVKDPWIAYRKPKPQASLRIFCFPYAGGGASAFRPWGNSLPPTVDLCPVQLPGRETRSKEPACPRIERLIGPLAESLRPYLEVPYAFFGYSMGALIAFDLARKLTSSGNGPSHVFLAARRGPRLPDPYPRSENFSTSEFIAHLKMFGGTPGAILDNPELLEIVLPTLRADFALCENYTYTPGEKLNCPLTVFGGTRDTELPEETLAAWSAETRSTCTIKMLEGDHFFLHSCQTELIGHILNAWQP
jgi:medium-chain acyl-[acyl-carrier-protein] hydrolase